MSGDPLYVQTEGVRSYGQIHDQVVTGLSQLTGDGAPEAAGVQTTHGVIADAVSTALSGVLGSRHGTIQTTASSGTTISGLLQQAAQAYERGDEQSGEELRAAAEALAAQQGSQAGSPRGSSGSPSSAAGGPSSAAGAGGSMMGQLLGQVGQQVGQLGQMAQPLAGLAQGLQQVPQQVMQGVQQAVQQAGQTGGALKSPDPRRGDPSPSDPQHPADGEPLQRAEPVQDAEAAPGASADTGRAPEHPRAERGEPTQTRPAD